MKIEQSEKDGIKIIALSGKIMGMPEESEFLDIINKIAAEGQARVILDLSGIDWMSSRGIGLCVHALTTLRENGGDLRLARISKNARILFEKTRLLSTFKHYKTIAKAAKSFGK